MPDAPIALPPSTHYRDGWVWPIADVRGWPVIREEVAHFPEILAHVPADRRRVAVQAGGNCGLMVRPIADAFEFVVTYEPNPINFACLEANIVDSNVEMVRMALGDSFHRVRLEMALDNCGACRVAKGPAGTGLFPQAILDEEVGHYGIADKLDLLMLDVEGYELHALRGAAETIARCKPVIVVELIGQAAVYGIDDIEIVGWLGERGYVCKAQVMRDSIFVWEPD